MKKILVTGGAGFIGSHLCSYLLDQGNEVICLDNFYTGSMKNIQGLLANPHFEVIRHDTIYPLRHIYVQQIYNLACPASPVHYQFDPVQTIKTNVYGAINVLELARSTKARILQASTSEVYGDPQVHPQDESYWGHVNPIGIRSCYDEGKRSAETLFFDYHRQYGVDIRVIRIFNTYGPNMHPEDGRVVSNFIMQALRGQDITIYGEGSQTRSFCYVSDLVDGMVKMMNKEAFIGPVNLGNPNEITIKQLAEKIIKATNSNSKIINKPLPKDDPVKRKPEITLAKKNLSWAPKIPLDEGLEKTIMYFKQLLEKKNSSWTPKIPLDKDQEKAIIYFKQLL